MKKWNDEHGLSSQKDAYQEKKKRLSYQVNPLIFPDVIFN